MRTQELQENSKMMCRMECMSMMCNMMMCCMSYSGAPDILLRI
ncbi:MAG: hypothetical protein ACI4ES_16235 [Roseburia sp.]